MKNVPKIVAVNTRQLKFHFDNPFLEIKGSGELLKLFISTNSIVGVLGFQFQELRKPVQHYTKSIRRIHTD